MVAGMKQIVNLVKIIFLVTSMVSFAMADSLQGSETLYLNQVRALSPSGAYLPAYDDLCVKQLARYLNGNITVYYHIGRSWPFLEKAKASYQHVKVPLYPLGIADKHAFMSSGVKSLDAINVVSIFFNKEKIANKNDSAAIQFEIKAPYHIDCVLSSESWKIGSR